MFLLYRDHPSNLQYQNAAKSTCGGKKDSP